MEDITFSEWSDRLDATGSNHWLPAYGYQQPTHLQPGSRNEEFLDSVKPVALNGMRVRQGHWGQTGSAHTEGKWSCDLRCQGERAFFGIANQRQVE
ncbi:ATP-dependent RNA helicase MAK5 [Gryllus bimaculatus]|nr:ATP-dependent RNA helicase MAK5 [Gryllus bimaculatus]